MTDELNLSELFSNLVKFISRNIKLLSIFMFVGLISVIGYQKLKTPFYFTKAICMSGISEYERQDQVAALSQRTAIDLINHLQINIENKDYSSLASSLGIDINSASSIKEIAAEQLYQQDMNEKYFTLNKFEISLITHDNNLNEIMKSGLLYYFENNQYVSNYHKLYIKSSKSLISEINDEIKALNQIRFEANMNSFTLGSLNTISGNNRKLGNEIIALSLMREEIKTNAELLTPLTFVQNFANVYKKENDVLILSLISVVLSFILGLFFAFVIEVKKI